MVDDFVFAGREGTNCVMDELDTSTCVAILGSLTVFLSAPHRIGINGGPHAAAITFIRIDPSLLLFL